MNEAYILSLGQKTLIVAMQLAVPVLGFSLVVGVLVSIVQAVTQIQDVTLSFVPKIISVIVALALFGPWMFRVLIEFTYNIFMSLPLMVR